MKTKYKKGDIVAVYGVDSECKGIRKIGMVQSLFDDGTLALVGRDLHRILDDGDTDYDLTVVHPKCCRKLKGQK